MASFDPISAVSDLVKTGLNKFVGDKMGEADKVALENDMEKFILQQGAIENGAFRQFVLDYAGSAKDVPKWILTFRALIRPLFTMLVGYLDYIYFTEIMTPEQITLLKPINVIVLGFWFGERAVTNSGIVDKLIGAFGNKKEKE